MVRSSPEDGAVDVPVDGVLRVDFDRALLPGSVQRRSVNLRSGAVRPTSFVHLDPITRSAFVELSADDPLEPSAVYELFVDGLVDLDGARQPEPYSVLFRTGVDVAPRPPEPAPAWRQVADLLTRRCAEGPCHSSGHRAAGLDLSSAAGVEATALGVPSSQSPAGASTAEGARGAFSLAALPIVDLVAGVGQPASSYLIYKLLHDPHVLGDGMPPEGPLQEANLQLLSGWIRAGAPTR